MKALTAGNRVSSSGSCTCSTPFLDSIEIARALRALRPPVLHGHDPELLPLFPAVKAFIPRLVYDMHEYVPEAVEGKHYIPEQVRPFVSRATAIAQKSLAALGSGCAPSNRSRRG